MNSDIAASARSRPISNHLKKRMHTVALLVFPGFQALGLALSSVFEYANLTPAGPQYTFSIVAENAGLVPCSQGFAVHAQAWGRRRFDTVIVAGDNDCAPAPQRLLSKLRQAAASARRVGAVCTGAFILAEAGLLDGKQATTHWRHTGAFAQRYPQVRLTPDRIFVQDGQLWTSAGMSAGVDLALALVEDDLGRAVVTDIARKLVLYQRRGGGQSQFSVLLDFDAKSDRVQSALGYAKENLRGELSVETLADVARLSTRQFSRLFLDETGHTPAKAIERLRVEAARLMLETSRHPVEVVAREVGFGDRERMRNAFLRAFGQPPQAFDRSAKAGRA